MNQLKIVIISICMISLTACTTSYYEPELYVHSKTAELERAYSALSSEERYLLNQHFTRSYVEDYVLHKRSGASHAQEALSELLQQAIEYKYKEYERERRERERNDRERAERERQINNKNKIDCDLFDATDFIPSPFTIFKVFGKLNKVGKIAKAQERGECK